MHSDLTHNIWQDAETLTEFEDVLQSAMTLPLVFLNHERQNTLSLPVEYLIIPTRE